MTSKSKNIATGLKVSVNTNLINKPFKGLYAGLTGTRGGIGKLKQVYFIGIGGIGMSALARYFHENGVIVSGYDKTPTMLTQQMETEGIKVYYEENIDRIPKNVDWVVYTPAIPADHKELSYYRQNGYTLKKRSEVLQDITQSSFNICVAGTHGKTTISTMTAHILRETGLGCNAFLGGIAVNYGTNYWSSSTNICVVEADEYDRSFLKLSPDIAVITAMDADHLDIYGTAEAMEQAFVEFSYNIKPDGLLIKLFGLKRSKELHSGQCITYSLQNKSADVYADNITLVKGGYVFDIILKDDRLENVKLNMGGMHNIENMVAAITIASSVGLEKEKIKSAVENFRGVKRRFEYIIRNDHLVFIDDYAHHPEELKALINATKTLFRQRKCTVIFQPHLYSRTRDLADGFAEALDLADEVILMPIYPARETAMEGISSEMILHRMKKNNKSIKSKEELMDWLVNDFTPAINKDFGEILITAGAGDIDLLVTPIEKVLKNIQM